MFFVIFTQIIIIIIIYFIFTFYILSADIWHYYHHPHYFLSWVMHFEICKSALLTYLSSALVYCQPLLYSLSIYQSIKQSIYLLIFNFLSIYQSIKQSIYLLIFNFLSIYLSIYLSISPTFIRPPRCRRILLACLSSVPYTQLASKKELIWLIWERGPAHEDEDEDE